MPSAPTLQLIAACGSKKQRRRNDESLEAFVARITHLDLTRKRLQGMDNINLCQALLVLYLYENDILKITNINSCANLTHLYLQHNSINRLEGIHRLRGLTKLFIGKNKIGTLEGLHDLHHLKELHIEHQLLPQGEKLLIDPRSMETLSANLRHLNIAGNNLDDLSDFTNMRLIKSVDVSHNKLMDIFQIQHAFGSCHTLTSLKVTNNPLCLLNKYREEIIVMVPSLEFLDQREITPTARQFLTNWKGVLDRRRRKSSYNNRRFPHKPQLSSKYRQPPFRRQGVVVSARFRSRLQPSNAILPPLDAHAIIDQQQVGGVLTERCWFAALFGFVHSVKK